MSLLLNTTDYIFIIWNKRDEHTIKVFDLKENTLYEGGDIKLFVGDEELNIKEFLDDAKTKTKREAYKPKTITDQIKNDKKSDDKDDWVKRYLACLDGDDSDSDKKTGWKSKK